MAGYRVRIVLRAGVSGARGRSHEFNCSW